MPDHAVWCEVAVAEARRCKRSRAVDVWSTGGHSQLETVLAGLPPLVYEDLGSSSCSAEDKHGRQEDSIIGHLMSSAISATAIVDFCCGRGALSDRLQATTLQRCSHVLIDWGSFKPGRCADHRMRRRVLGASVTRLEADVDRVDLASVLPACDDRGQVVMGMTKHACGPASDAILRCTRGFDASRSRAASQQQPPPPAPPTALFLATCCHHRCTWDSYEGRSYFAALGLSRGDFETAVALSHWATLDGEGHDGKACGGGDKVPGCVDAAAADPALSLETKMWLGVRCKQLLDLGRVHALESCGRYGSVRLVQYTRLSVEDRLIVALPLVLEN